MTKLATGHPTANLFFNRLEFDGGSFGKGTPWYPFIQVGLIYFYGSFKLSWQESPTL